MTAMAGSVLASLHMDELEEVPMNFVIRAATLADIETIFYIRTSVRENHLSRSQLTEMGITPESIAQALAHAPCAWIAEVYGDPVGFSMVELDEGCVFAAFVLPAFEGCGVGRALMR